MGGVSAGFLASKRGAPKMFKNTFQSGFLSILYSIGSKPLQIWDKQVRNGHIKRITDPDIQSSVLEIMGTNVSTNYINAPLDPKKTLAIKLPFLVMIIKNLKKYFTIEVQVLDDKSVRRRFRRIYFSDRLYTEDELPPEFKLFLPVAGKP